MMSRHLIRVELSMPIFSAYRLSVLLLILSSVESGTLTVPKKLAYLGAAPVVSGACQFDIAIPLLDHATCGSLVVLHSVA